MERVYLDYGASTPVDKRVLEAMIPYFREKFGNPSSIHIFGREAKVGLERARESIAHLIHAQPEELFFTSGGTEADNWGIIGYCLQNREVGNNIITSCVEHYAVLNSCKYLETQGFSVTYLPAEPDGTVDLDRLKKAITPKTLLVSIMHVNNEIGIINDINAIGAITREHGTVFHTDAVQGFGKIPINVRQMNIDLLSISGHKLYAPKGIGALYVRKGIHLQKLLHGGSNERNWRSGTENVASAVGLGASAAFCKTEMEQEADALRKLRNYFWAEIQKNIPDVRLNGALEPRLPGNLNVSFKSADGESILLSLDLYGIAASAGSACESGSIELTHVIKALNPPLEYAQSAIRFTIGRWTTRTEIDYTISALKEIIERVRKFERKT